jgi:type IV secretion system protein VirB9
MSRLRVLYVLCVLAVWSSAAVAAVAPRPSAGDPRIQVVSYDPDEVVEVHATMGFEVTIEFGHGEHFENIAVGDSAAWQVTPNKRGDLLFVKPVRKRATTNMTVITNLRRYDFNLKANEAEGRDGARPPVFGIRFDYPVLESHAAVLLKPSPPSAPETPQPPKVVNADYSFEGSSELIPAKVFDDGAFTYFAFSANEDYPAIYDIENDGKESLINYSVSRGYIVIDKLAAGFVLRQGALVTRIFNDGFKRPAPTADSPRPRARKGWFDK